ncbi:MAG: HEPN domain-containing protein [Planctomycetes bacterium]|nr:HEPN domain-containing protein [Planctomycetota bacterium]
MARQPLPPEGFLEDACFLLQQAAELAIKAVYQQCGWSFRYVHDLGELLDGLESRGMAITPELRRAERLTSYAVEARYPGLAPPITDAEYQEALQIAENVLSWAESLIP